MNITSPLRVNRRARASCRDFVGILADDQGDEAPPPGPPTLFSVPVTVLLQPLTPIGMVVQSPFREELTMPEKDAFSSHYAELLNGDYDCVDRVVLNGYFQFGNSPGGFRLWWRALVGSDDKLDNNHLMRLAGRFSRRLRAWAKSDKVPVMDCRKGERKQDISQEFLPKDPQFIGLFCVLVGRAPMAIWDVRRYGNGGIDLRKKTAYVNHYSFHIMDPQWGHVIIKLCGHPPFNAQIIVNGHEYVARQARRKGLVFSQEGNCFTEISNAVELSRCADTLCHSDTIGRLRELCERWIYTTCLCFALDTQDQKRTGFQYQYSVYQAEYSRNLLFRSGAQMERVFQWLIDRTRSALDLRTVKRLFGLKRRPGSGPGRFEVTVERPTYDLTVFKVHYGRLTLKVYTKGERVLRIEAIVHNVAVWNCRRGLEHFPDIVRRLREMLYRFLEALRCVHVSWITNDTLECLPEPSICGSSRVAGINLNQPRMRAVFQGILALATQPGGFLASELAERVKAITKRPYEARHAAYDLKKLRAKALVQKPAHTRRYEIPADALRTIAALTTLREHVLRPLLAGIAARPRRKPRHYHVTNAHYKRIQFEFQQLFKTLNIAA